MDVSRQALKVCKQRGLRKTRLLSLDNIEKLGSNSFDTAIMFGFNFGLFENPCKLRVYLKKLAKVLGEKGVIIAQSADIFRAGAREHIAYGKWNLRHGRAAGQARFRIRYRDVATSWFDFLFAGRRELSGFLEGSGWVVKKTISSRKSPAYFMVLARSDVK